MKEPSLSLETLREIALDQHGFVTTIQALEAGVTKPNLSNLVSRGRLERVVHGVYRVPQIPHTQYGAYMLALLWTGVPEAALSHETALDAYAVSDINPHKIHVTVDKSRRIKRAGGASYLLHKENLVSQQKTWWEQMPIVKLPTAIEQCIAYGTPSYLLRQAIGSGRRIGLVSAEKEKSLTHQLERRNEQMFANVGLASYNGAGTQKGGLMAKKGEIITVKGTDITTLVQDDFDYISLTDMIRAKDGDFFIADWLRNRNTVEFLGIWESIHNPRFNYGGFAIIKSKAGLNNYKISVKEWVEQTGAIGLIAKAGRYGGTYAHKDIAFEFGMWISPEFKVYLIREFDRLKTEEQKRLSAEWNLQRTLAKINYRIHTDAIKAHIIPPEVTKTQANFTYASEADLLNVALFGQTASQWRAEHPSAKGNIRDEATLEQLIVLSNMESINALLIGQSMLQGERLSQLNKVAITQMTSLLDNQQIKQLSERH